MSAANARLRDILIIAVLLASAAFVLTRPAQKNEVSKKVDLQAMVPMTFDKWLGRAYDTSDYSDKWQSINELCVRAYAKPNVFSFRSPATILSFVLEYSSDVRQNFSFHFPENCHRAGGNEVQFLKPEEVDLGNGKIFKAKRIFIKGLPNSPESVDKIVTYWLVLDGKPYFETFFIKLDQMMSGLLSRAKSGFLVRVDYVEGLEYTPEGIAEASKTTQEFIKDLYTSLDPEKRAALFGKEYAQ